MQLTDDDVREFIEMWQAEFKEEITAAEARQCAIALLELYALIAQPPQADEA